MILLEDSVSLQVIPFFFSVYMLFSAFMHIIFKKILNILYSLVNDYKNIRIAVSVADEREYSSDLGRCFVHCIVGPLYSANRTKA